MSAPLHFSLFGMLSYRTRAWGITQCYQRIAEHRKSSARGGTTSPGNGATMHETSGNISCEETANSG